jgi:hypothetical protein
MSTNESQKYFLSRFNDSRIKTIQYQKSWDNGAAHYDYAVNGENAIKLQPAEMVKTTSSNGCKMIFVGTQLGPVVVFERYANVLSIVVATMSARLLATNLVRLGALDVTELKQLLAQDFNLGDLIKRLASTFGIETKITETDEIVSVKIDTEQLSSVIGSVSLDTEAKFKTFTVWENDYGDLFLEHNAGGNTFKVTKEGFGEPTISFYD